MALRQLLNRSCNSPDAVFRTIRDFLAAANGIDDFSADGSNPGPGYEILDASYASGDPANTTTGDWCALRSYGEAEAYPHYLLLEFGATQHTIKTCLGWNAQTHTGFGVAYYKANIYHNGAGDVILYVYADLDECHIVIKPQAVSNWYWHPFGRLKPGMLLYDGEAVQVAAPVVAGAGAEIVLPAWPAWAKVGAKIYNWDNASLHELEIVAANEATRVVGVAEAWAKSSGSWLAEDVFILNNAGHNYTAGESKGIYGLPSHTSSVAAAAAYNAVFPVIAGRDDKYERRYACDIWIQRDNEIRGRFANARMSRYPAASQGEAWVDEVGRAWRLHNVHSGVGMAFLEAA